MNEILYITQTWFANQVQRNVREKEEEISVLKINWKRAKILKVYICVYEKYNQFLLTACFRPVYDFILFLLLDTSRDIRYKTSNSEVSK